MAAYVLICRRRRPKGEASQWLGGVGKISLLQEATDQPLREVGELGVWGSKAPQAGGESAPKEPRGEQGSPAKSVISQKFNH